MEGRKALQLESLESLMAMSAKGGGGSPDLEIVRPDRNQGCTSSSSSPALFTVPEKRDISLASDHELEDLIEKYQGLNQKLVLPDKNCKLEGYIRSLIDEKARRQSRNESGNQVEAVKVDDMPASERSVPLDVEVLGFQLNISTPKQQQTRHDLDQSSAVWKLENCKGSCSNSFTLTTIRQLDGIGDLRKTPPPVECQDLDESCTVRNFETSKGSPCSNSFTTTMRQLDGIGDLRKAPSPSECQECSVCQQNFPRQPIGSHDNLLCSSCKESSTASPASDCSPMETFSASLRPNRRPAASKRPHGAVGDTLDTALELSDDDEGVAVIGQSVNSSNLSKRNCLPSSAKRSASVTLLYPSSSDPDAVEVCYGDLAHLAPGEFLNDTVIDFYIKYIQHNFLEEKERQHCFHFFSCFFFKKLKSEKAKGNDGFAKVHKWTKGVNIFEKKYLFVPIHDSFHWSLAVICYPGQKVSCILHMDSMSQTAGHSSKVIYNILKRYLVAERKHLLKENDGVEDLTEEQPKFVCKRMPVPLQDNEWDCGLFVLCYIQRFVAQVDELDWTDPDEKFGKQWFKPNEASELRATIKSILETIFHQDSSFSSMSS